MAEENNLENELETPNDPLGDDLNDMDLLQDDELGDPAGDDATPNEDDDSDVGSESRLRQLLSNRRALIIGGGVVALIAIIGGGFMLLSGNKSTPSNQPAMVQQDAPKFDGASIVKKKPEKKKKKKIKYIDLYKQLEKRDLSPILRELSYLNINFNVIQNGKQFDLQIDEDQLEEAKQILAIKGMPSGTAQGYEIFDEASNLGVTEFDKRIRLIRALSGEMEKTIMEFDVVDYAYVEIVIPETKLFAATQPPVTSSILIKRQNGSNINDETVYAIMQLVSNSVENLLPENISVVDTEGRVLSTGVLERMENKIKALQDKTQKKETQSIGDGKVIIPEIADVVDWFQLKFNYETVLEKKAINQLQGVLPVGSFKAAVTIDLNSVTTTGAPDIKKIVASVVVDDQFEEVELDAQLTEQITQAVAGAIGFQESRDTIHISKAAFLPKRVTEADAEATFDKKQIVIPEESFMDKTKRFFRLWPIFAIGSAITILLIICAWFLKALSLGIISVVKLIPNIFKRKKKEDEESVEVDTESINEPEEDIVLNEQDVINAIKSKSDYSKSIQLKALSTQNIEVLVEELKELIKG